MLKITGLENHGIISAHVAVIKTMMFHTFPKIIFPSFPTLHLVHFSLPKSPSPLFLSSPFQLLIFIFTYHKIHEDPRVTTANRFFFYEQNTLETCTFLQVHIYIFSLCFCPKLGISLLELPFLFQICENIKYW